MMAPPLPLFSFLFAAMATALLLSSAAAQEQPSAEERFVYPVKFVCGPSSEAFQEGMVAGFAATAVNILNPSLDRKVQYAKRVSRALPYQAAGPISGTIQDVIGPLQAIEIECNEIRQLLPSQMTEEFRTGYLVIQADAELEVVAVYSARPRDGEVSTLDVERISGTKAKGVRRPAEGRADLTPRRPECVRPGTGEGNQPRRVRVEIRNRGDGDAGPSITRAEFAGKSSVSQQTPAVAAGSATTVQFDIPERCPADCRFRVLADAAETVSESNEDNNAIRGRCLPLPQ